MLYPLNLYPHSSSDSNLRPFTTVKSPSKLPFSKAKLQARFVNCNLFSVAGTSCVMASSRPPVLWHQCWAWDSLSSTTKLLCSPMGQWRGFSHSTAVFFSQHYSAPQRTAGTEVWLQFQPLHSRTRRAPRLSTLPRW